MRVIGADELRRLVPMARAIAAVERAFREGDAETPPRQHLAFGDGELLFMPSWNQRGAGVKLVSIEPANPGRGVPLINGSYLLFDRATLQPDAVIDAAALTALRTAAVSGVATAALAEAAAQRLVIFGAGAQGRAHLEAMIAVRPIAEVVVVSRSEGPAVALVEHARSLGLTATMGDPAEAVADADVVCTCTCSPEPVFPGSRLSPSAHVNAVGSYQRHVREIDTDTIRRAALVVVETDDAVGESGDLADPIAAGVLDPTTVASLRDVLDRVKPPGAEITVFKSVGRAFEDLAVAEAALSALD